MLVSQTVESVWLSALYPVSSQAHRELLGLARDLGAAPGGPARLLWATAHGSLIAIPVRRRLACR